MTTFGTFNDPPLAPYADIELAAADARIHARQYRDLAYCRKHSLCWWCGEPVDNSKHGNGGIFEYIPTCNHCKRERQVEVRE